jgi:hypothetical protein
LIQRFKKEKYQPIIKVFKVQARNIGRNKVVIFERRCPAGIRGLPILIGVTEERQRALQTWLKLEPTSNQQE